NLPMDGPAAGYVPRYRRGDHRGLAAAASAAQHIGYLLAQPLQQAAGLRAQTHTMINMTSPTNGNGDYAIEARDLHIYYGSFRAVKNIDLQFRPRQITALIGPSGCGKSTVLRAFNRMNDLIPTARAAGVILFLGKNNSERAAAPVEVRRLIGSTFQ